MPFFSTTFLSLSFSFSDHHTLSFSPSRLSPPPQTTNSFLRVYSPSSSPPSPPPPQPTPPTHFYSQSQSQILYEMMSEEQHRESKLSNNRHCKLHLRVSKILNEMQTRTASFQDWNGTDGLGFGFGIGCTVITSTWRRGWWVKTCPRFWLCSR